MRNQEIAAEAMDNLILVSPIAAKAQKVTLVSGGRAGSYVLKCATAMAIRLDA